MTSPVEQSQSADGWVVSFMVPGRYSLETVPQPTDPRVSIRRVPGELRAVIRYRGRWTTKLFDKKSSALLSGLKDAGIEPSGPIQFALYDAPFKPPFMRRNEVHVTVPRLPAAASDDLLARDSSLAR